jgi:hypothetical protein
MYQYVPVHLLHSIPNVGLPTLTMVTTRSKTHNARHWNLPQESTSQDKKVEPQHSRLTSKEAKQHTNDVDAPVPSINKQTDTRSCVCGFTHHFEYRVIYHMRICPFCKDSLMPVHITKSLEALTELNRNPHSLRTSLESLDQTMLPRPQPRTLQQVHPKTQAQALQVKQYPIMAHYQQRTGSSLTNATPS